MIFLHYANLATGEHFQRYQPPLHLHIVWDVPQASFRLVKVNLQLPRARVVLRGHTKTVVAHLHARYALKTHSVYAMSPAHRLRVVLATKAHRREERLVRTTQVTAFARANITG